MTELERLERRRDSWLTATGPKWLLWSRDQTLRKLEAEIAELKASEGTGHG